jgi:hypothetical protein
MKRFRLVIFLVLALGMFVLNFQTALAFPPLPSSFYGRVKINGSNVPTGTVISARINGVQYAFSTVLIYLGDTVYSLDIPGDDPETTGIIEGGVEGDTVVFFIGTSQVAQTATWHGATNVSLNLIESTGQITIFLPLVLR